MLEVFGDRIACSVQHACIGVPWQLRPVQRKLARFLVLVAEADQGVALVIVMPAVTRVHQRRYVTKRHLVKYGHTDDCQACTQLAAGMHHAKVLHDGRCRDRIGELMAEDYDQRPRHEHSQRILLPEAGEEMDVSESTVCVDVPLARPAPTNQVCGSPISGSRAYAMNTDERECGKFAENRRRKRQGEDVEELEANGEEQRLDADVQVPAPKNFQVEDFAGDAAAAAPEQMQTEGKSMNRLTSRQTDVLEKIEESLRQCKGSRRSQR